MLSCSQENESSAFDSEHTGNAEAAEPSGGPERITDTDNIPAVQTHAYLKILMGSGGDHGLQAFRSWLGLMHDSIFEESAGWAAE